MKILLLLFVRKYRNFKWLFRRRIRICSVRTMRQLQMRHREIIERGKTGYTLRLEDLGLNESQLVAVKEALENNSEVVIADIDQDGLCFSYFGQIGDLPTVNESEFQERRRFKMQLVAFNGVVSIKKDFRKNKVSFVNELNILSKLNEAGCNVPSVLRVDFDNLVLILSYIHGRVLKEELVRQGAMRRYRDMETSQRSKALPQMPRWGARMRECRRVMRAVVDEQFIERLLAEVRKIHSCGVAMLDLNYENLVIENKSGQPYLIDFENARALPQIPKFMHNMVKRTDIEITKLLFGM